VYLVYDFNTTNNNNNIHERMARLSWLNINEGRAF